MVMEKNIGFDPRALEDGAALLTLTGMEARGATSTEKDEKVATSVAERAKVDAAPLSQLKEAAAVLKGKAPTAGEYAAAVTRLGVSMFGEPKIGSMVKAGADGDRGSAMRWGSVISNKVRAAAGEYYAAIRAHRGSEPETGSKAEGGGPKVQG